MTCDAIPTVTDAELASHGFIPDNIIGSKRIPGWPVKLRHGDNLVERSESGGITVWFGYFTASQIEYRRLLSQIMCKKFNKGLLRYE